jgi:hypothetical protein
MNRRRKERGRGGRRKERSKSYRREVERIK